MKPLLVLFLVLSPLLAKSEEVPGLTAFAEEYWSAVHSLDADKIFALYDPKVFSGLSPEEVSYMKAYWMKGYVRTMERKGDSHEISGTVLPSDSNPLPTWRWSGKPEYQFQIQTFKTVPQGREGGNVLAEMAVKKDDRFFVIRPVPPQEELTKQMNKGKGS